MKQDNVPQYMTFTFSCVFVMVVKSDNFKRLTLNKTSGGHYKLLKLWKQNRQFSNHLPGEILILTLLVSQQAKFL